ncbi:MAG: hypothetical protein FJY07_11070, partial [Bacteroidetes bacterium]|nr:hypothetical protein [Bacteroidota bacterium]
VQAAGIELQEKGNRFWGCCPFHQEQTASFTVDVEGQRFRCFGCGENGDSIAFIMKLKNLRFEEVCKFLNIQGDGFKASEKEAKQREIIRRFRVWCDDYTKLLCESLRMCNQIDSLILSPEQLEIIGLAEMYLKKDVFQYHLSIMNSKNDYLKFQLYTEVVL